MSMNHRTMICLALLLLCGQVAADCRISLAPPYTGPLLIDSKYDQSDASKSTLANKEDLEGWDSKARIEAFSRQMVEFSNAYLMRESPSHKAMALACMSESLTNWASANALLTDQVSGTGRAVRKWALAALSSTLRKTIILSNGEFVLTDTQRAWLSRVADSVVKDYTPRQDPSFRYFNNHDYWAAWAVASTGMVVNNQRYIDWGYRVFDLAMQQIELGEQGRIGWLPNEVGRGPLGAEYTHYAITPLALLANHAAENKHPLDRQQNQRLQALANFAVIAAMKPEALGQLEGRQRSVPNHKLSWLIPFLAEFPEHTAALVLYFDQDAKVDGYSQIGGLIGPLYDTPRSLPSNASGQFLNLIRSL